MSNWSRNGNEKRKFNDWLDEGQKKIVLKVKDTKELFFYKEAAEAQGLITALIKDAGHTEIPAGTITCLGIGPAPEEDIDKITGSLPLMN